MNKKKSTRKKTVDAEKVCNFVVTARIFKSCCCCEILGKFCRTEQKAGAEVMARNGFG